MLLTFFFYLAALPAVNSNSHANSISVSTIEVNQFVIRHELELQTLSILEVLPDLDADANAILSKRELEQGQASLRDYLATNYTFRLNDSTAEPLTGRLVSIAESVDAGDPLMLPLQRVKVIREFQLDALPSTLRIDVALFSISSPDHRDFCTLQFQDQLAEQWLFTGANSAWEYVPDKELESRLTQAFALNGLQACLRFNVYALLLLFVFACPTKRAAGQTLTLFIASAGAAAMVVAYTDIQPPIRIIQLALILAVPYVGVENALRGEPRRPLIEAALFGCLLGIHSVQRLLPELEDLPLVPRAVSAHSASFVGTYTLIALLAVWLTSKLGGKRHEQSLLAPNWLRNYASIVLALIGLGRFIQLAWFDGTGPSG